METFEERTTRMLDRLDLTINGEDKVNGDPGLKGEVRALRKEVEALKKNSDTTSQRAWTVALSAAAGFVASWVKGATT